MPTWLHRNPRLQIGMLLLAPFLITAIVPGSIAPYSPTDLLGRPFEPPTSELRLGTDELGRDIFSRLVYAARTDIKISLGATLLAALIGISIGFWRRLSRRLAGARRRFGSPM